MGVDASRSHLLGRARIGCVACPGEGFLLVCNGGGGQTKDSFEKPKIYQI